MSVKRRRGIIRLHNERGNGNAAGSFVSFDDIAASKKALRLVFSYYTNSIWERGLQYGWRIALAFEAVLARREGLRQREVVRRHHRGDPTGKGGGRGFWIRFQCKADSLHENVLIDRVQLLGLLDGMEVKDLI